MINIRDLKIEKLAGVYKLQDLKDLIVEQGLQDSVESVIKNTFNEGVDQKFKNDRAIIGIAMEALLSTHLSAHDFNVEHNLSPQKTKEYWWDIKVNDEMYIDTKVHSHYSNDILEQYVWRRWHVEDLEDASGKMACVKRNANPKLWILLINTTQVSEECFDIKRIYLFRSTLLLTHLKESTRDFNEFKQPDLYLLAKSLVRSGSPDILQYVYKVPKHT